MSPVEQRCLERIKKGLLRFTPDGRVELFRGRRWHVLGRHINCSSGRARYRFGGGYVYANRLHYLLSVKREIPEGCFVDHKDENRKNDCPDNLQIHEPGQSHRQGCQIQADKKLAMLGRWFQFMADFGREPELPHEITFLYEGF